MPAHGPYYREALALAHHEGYGDHADQCAPGILALLAPVRERDGLVLELGCGSGRLTRHLAAAGHRVIATDASLAMLRLARANAVGAVQPDASGAGGLSASGAGQPSASGAGQPSASGVVEFRRLVLPDDPLPAADAIVSVGHVLSYLPDEAAVHRALVAAATALHPGGVLALDLCDLSYGPAHLDPPSAGRRSADWVLVIEFSLPAPDRFARDITVFTRGSGDCWVRDDEHHENVLADTAVIPGLLAGHGVKATVGSAFGSETLPPGLVTIIGTRAA